MYLLGNLSTGRLSSGLSSPPLAPHNNLRGDNCIQGSPSTAGPVMLFVLAQLLLGCGGSPLFTLGTTYIDDHVRPESASLYIGESLYILLFITLYTQMSVWIIHSKFSFYSFRLYV